MKYFFEVICLVVIVLSSTAFAGGGTYATPYAPGLDPTQSPTQSPQIFVEPASDKDEGIPIEIWVAIIGVFGAIGTAFVGAYFQKRKSSK